MNQTILTQGHLDGFCLLYSIMNSYKSLTSPNELATKFSFKVKNQNKWIQLIGITPSLHNFVSGKKGSSFDSKKVETEVQLKSLFISSCFNVISDVNKKLISYGIKFKDILKTDFSTSNLIICFRSGTKLEQGESGDHWVSVVGFNATENKLLLACSYTSHEKGLTEKKDTETNTIYNNAIEIPNLSTDQIYVNEIYKVSKQFT